MDSPAEIPEPIPLDKPNVARMYDCWLGGYHNFEIDRIAVEQLAHVYPDLRAGAFALRAFLRRMVQFLVHQGLDQFLDIGSGLPTQGNVHEVAQGMNPAARIVYVDIDPVAVAHGRAMLRDNPGATFIRGDVARPDQILNHAEAGTLLDFHRPVAVTLICVLHFVLDDEVAYQAVRILREALVPGSYLAIVHSTHDDAPSPVCDEIHMLYAGSGSSYVARSRTEIRRFFAGLELVEPGVVRPPEWRPEGSDDLFVDQPNRVLGWVGVGRKP